MMIVQEEFVFTQAPFASCHASSLVETSQGLLCCWFGGTEEGHDDVGIWLSRQNEAGWSKPIELVQDRYPCWNPVLFQAQRGPLQLFYKLGPNPREWWGMVISSQDGGHSWSKPVRLATGILGAIKNKPIQLANGDILAPCSDEAQGWTVHMERSSDNGQTWTRSQALNDPETFAAIQPTLLHHRGGRIQALCRSKQGVITELHSEDNGLSWSQMKALKLPNNNSGFDATTLFDGRHVLVYNPVGTPTGQWGGDRTPLSLAISADGEDWQDICTLEQDPGEYSYPAVIQSSDGLIHLSYTWRRERIKHVALKLA